jgi:4-amino-4-deoxy-L-arabinose transferase-like glycosyltransferase
MATNIHKQIINFLKKPEVLISIAFFLFHTLFLNTVSISDEGTHALISLFYRDVLANFISNPSLSGVYDFAINYLVHLPKLSLYYLPLFHIVGSFFFYVTQSIFVLRLENLVISAASIFFVYRLTLALTKNKNTATVATLLLAFSPIFNITSIGALTDNLLILAGLILIYVWYGFLENQRYTWLQVAALSAVLLFSRMQVVLLFIALVIYAVYRKKLRVALRPILIAAALFTIFLLLLLKLGILEVFLSSSVSAVDYSMPDVLSFDALSFYPIVFLLEYITPPLTILAAFKIFVWTKNRAKQPWQALLLILVLVNMVFFFTRNKNPRYPYLILIPLVIAAAEFISPYLTSIRKYFFVAFLLVIAVLAVGAKYTNPLVSYDFLNLMDERGSVLIASEKDEIFSSVVMFEYAKDHGPDRVFYRPCSIFEEDRDTILSRSKYLLVVDPPGEPNLAEQRASVLWIKANGNLTLLYQNQTKYGEVSLFKNQFALINESCNYVCAKKEWVCT